MIRMVPLLHAQARLDHDTLCRPFARMRLNNILHNSLGRPLDYARDSNHSFDRTVRNDLRVSSVKGLVCGRRSTTKHTIVESNGHNLNHRRRQDGASVEDALQKLVRHPLVLLQRQAEERCLEKPGANRCIQQRRLRNAASGH